MQNSITQHCVAKNVHFANWNHNIGTDPKVHKAKPLHAILVNGGFLILHVMWTVLCSNIYTLQTYTSQQFAQTCSERSENVTSR